MTGLPARDGTRPQTEQGLYAKFEVRRTDGRDAPGGNHDGCEYFVLDLSHDPFAPVAAAAYAKAAEATHPQLAADICARYSLCAHVAALPPQGEQQLADLSPAVQEALGLLRPALCEQEPLWRALCTVMSALPAQVEQQAVGKIVPKFDAPTIVCLFNSDLPVGTLLYTRPQPVTGDGDVRDRVMGELEQWFDTQGVDLAAATDSVIAALSTQPAPSAPEPIDAVDAYRIWSESQTAWHQLLPPKPDRNYHFAKAIEAEVLRRLSAPSEQVAASDLPPPGVPFVGCQCPSCGEEFAASAASVAVPGDERVKCDGNHGGPRCADPECWNDDPAAVQTPVAPWQAQVADALDSFWNPACEAVRAASYHGPASGADVVGAIAQGLAAVSRALREGAPAAPSAARDLTGPTVGGATEAGAIVQAAAEGRSDG